MEVKLPVKIEKKVVEMGKKELSKFDLIANEIVGLVLQNGRFGILDTVYRAEFYDANSSWFPLLTNILLSIRPWFYLHMATDARRKAIVYVTVVASCPMCPTYIYIYMFNRVPLDHDVTLHWNTEPVQFFWFLKTGKNLTTKYQTTSSSTLNDKNL